MVISCLADGHSLHGLLMLCWTQKFSHTIHTGASENARAVSENYGWAKMLLLDSEVLLEGLVAVHGHGQREEEDWKSSKAVG